MSIFRALAGLFRKSAPVAEVAAKEVAPVVTEAATVARHSHARRAIPAAVLALLVPFLSGWEGMDLVAHHQRIDPPGVITYCVGATNYDNPKVRVGQRFSKAQCEQYLIQDLPKYEAELNKCIDTSTLPTKRHAALLDATYNLGGGTMCRSSIIRLIKQGRIKEGCRHLLLYDRANGRVLRGLQNRRKAEYALCIQND